jgi:hypothetical protein
LASQKNTLFVVSADIMDAANSGFVPTDRPLSSEGEQMARLKAKLAGNTQK